jgi:hypothetical protein
LPSFTRPELKFRANSSSPLKWTEILGKLLVLLRGLDLLARELIPWRVMRLVQDVSKVTLRQNPIAHSPPHLM